VVILRGPAPRASALAQTGASPAGTLPLLPRGHPPPHPAAAGPLAASASPAPRRAASGTMAAAGSSGDGGGWGGGSGGGWGGGNWGGWGGWSGGGWGSGWQEGWWGREDDRRGGGGGGHPQDIHADAGGDPEDRVKVWVGAIRPGCSWEDIRAALEWGGIRGADLCHLEHRPGGQDRGGSSRSATRLAAKPLFRAQGKTRGEPGVGQGVSGRGRPACLVTESRSGQCAAGRPGARGSSAWALRSRQGWRGLGN
jgi:hypothetical protein